MGAISSNFLLKRSAQQLAFFGMLFMLVSALGVSAGIYHTVKTYGWVYSRVVYVGDELVNEIVFVKSQLVFNAFLYFLALSNYVQYHVIKGLEIREENENVNAR